MIDTLLPECVLSSQLTPIRGIAKRMLPSSTTMCDIMVAPYTIYYTVYECVTNKDGSVTVTESQQEQYQAPDTKG